MAAKRYKYLTVKVEIITQTKNGAEALAKDIEKRYAGARAEIVPHALDKCPGRKDGSGGQDHAHARYDGDTWCPYCEAEL